jgi:signal transduction histidine kinase/ActR/RegA family two-component response regulator
MITVMTAKNPKVRSTVALSRKHSPVAACLFAAFIMPVLCAGILLFSTPVCAADPAQDNTRHILYISSYSYSWGTVPNQIEGISRAFEGQNYIINYEFMDTKNTVYSDGYKEFYNLLKYKLSTRYRYDGVIVADDAALNFAELYKDELFSGIPITFLGIDNVENGEKAALDPDVTGIVEQADYARNIEIAHKLLPEATRITFILDNRENGIGIAKQLEKQKQLFKNYQVSYLNTSEYTREEICSKLSSFTDQDIVFFISMGQQKNGIILTENERYQMIRQYTSIPVFRLSNAGIGNGALGGYVVDFNENGYIAASMLRQMIESPDSQKPAMRYDTPGMYYFDYAIMKKYGLKTSLLPRGTTIINQPESIWKTYSSQIIIGLLLVLLMASVYYLMTIRRAKKKLEINNGKLERANDAKSVFLSNVSHDLRTPLNGILGFTEIGLQKKTADEKQQCLQKISLSGHLLLDLVNDTLELSRIESGKMKLDLEDVDCRKVAVSVLVSAQQMAEEKGVSFIIHTDDFPDGIIRVDQLKLEKIILNLLSNAIKFTPKGGTVSYAVEAIDPPDNGMTRRLIIEDTGIGMSDEFMEHLYEPFSQERRADSAGVQGTGLGLSIVKNMVDMMGGTITVNSRINKGTRFVVELPIVCSDYPVSTEITQPEIPDGQLAGKRILLCEDNAMNMEIACILLQQKKIHVDCAVNGREGLEKFSVSPADYYAAVLMDLRMPVMNGYEATKAIRGLERPDAGTVPIIAMTADAFDENVKEARNAGLNDYITKPIDTEKLYRTLERNILNTERNKNGDK